MNERGGGFYKVASAFLLTKIKAPFVLENTCLKWVNQHEASYELHNNEDTSE